MITGVAPHAGGKRLAAHLTKLGKNDAISVRVRGIPTGSVEQCLTNLSLMAIGARTATPLIHSHANPSRAYSAAEWQQYWSEFERVFRLDHQPYVEVTHRKIGPSRIAPHVHRVYLRVLPNRRLVSLSHSFLRSERVSRWAEFTNGETQTKGRFNLAVASALRADGRMDVADAMKKAGLLDGSIPIATKPHERQMTEKAGDISRDEACRRIWRAWTRSDNGAAFVTALREAGLTIAMGTSLVVAVTARGVVHPLRRALRMGAVEAGANPVTSAELAARLAGLDIRPVEAAKAQAAPAEVLGAYQATGAERGARSATMGGRRASRRAERPIANPRKDKAAMRLSRSPLPDQDKRSEQLIRSLSARTTRAAPLAQRRAETRPKDRDEQTLHAARPRPAVNSATFAHAKPAVGAGSIYDGSSTHRTTPNSAPPKHATSQRAASTAANVSNANTSRVDVSATAAAKAQASSTRFRRTRLVTAADLTNTSPPEGAARPVPPGRKRRASHSGKVAPNATLSIVSAAHPSAPRDPLERPKAATAPLRNRTVATHLAKREETRLRWPLTAAQAAAIQMFLTTFEGGAANEVAAMHREAEEAAERRAVERRRAHDARLAAARASYRDLDADLSRPSIGVPGWKDEYKATLAGLPKQLGARILWVETSVAERRIVILRSGEQVHLMANRATGSEATHSAATVMVEHARSRRWASVVFSGGTASWRMEAARLATRRGVVVANVELAAIVDDERRAMRAEESLARWRQAREAISREPESTSLRTQFIAALRALMSADHAEFASERDQDVVAYDFRMLRTREAALAGTGYEVPEFETFMTETWRDVRQPAHPQSRAAP